LRRFSSTRNLFRRMRVSRDFIDSYSPKPRDCGAVEPRGGRPLLLFPQTEAFERSYSAPGATCAMDNVSVRFPRRPQFRPSGGSFRQTGCFFLTCAGKASSRPCRRTALSTPAVPKLRARQAGSISPRPRLASPFRKSPANSVKPQAYSLWRSTARPYREPNFSPASTIRPRTSTTVAFVNWRGQRPSCGALALGSGRAFLQSQPRTNGYLRRHFR
jgi:hypothetical protein